MPRALPANMRASRRWLPLALAHLLWSVPAVSFAQPPAQTPSQQSALSPDQEEEEEIEELEEEVGDRDPTYLRTRTVFRYDHRLLGPASIDRFRLRLLYGFGPKQRYAVSAIGPLVQTETPPRTARGAGDAEVQLNANILYGERFRTGVAVQAAFQTSSDALIGGATTTVRPSIDFTGVLSRHLEVVATLYYKHSIHTARGLPFKQFEPDLIVNTRVLKATLVPPVGLVLRHLSGTIRPNVEARSQPCVRTESALGRLRVLRNRAQRLRPTDAVPLQRRSRHHVVPAQVQIDVQPSGQANNAERVRFTDRIVPREGVGP